MNRDTAHRFFDDWHRHSIDLPDGDSLTWIVIAEPAPARVECPRTGRRGTIDVSVAMAMLAEVGHPDAQLAARTTPTFGAGVCH